MRQLARIDDAREAIYQMLVAVAASYGIGVMAHDCARVAIARNEDHIIGARERPLQSRGILVVRNAQGDSRWQGACLRLGRPGPLRPRRGRVTPTCRRRRALHGRRLL